MMTLARLAIVTLFLGGVACQRGAVQPAEQANEEVRKLVLAVDGMHCDTCPLTVRTAAGAVPGVTAVKVTTEPGRAVVSYRPSATSPAAIAAAITESGYPAHELPTATGP